MARVTRFSSNGVSAAIAVGLVAILTVTACTSSRRDLSYETEGFCGVAQRLANEPTFPLTNVMLVDFESFKKSKPKIEPLTTTEYWTYADAARTRPVQVSCKLVSADHFERRYGGRYREAPCRRINANTLRVVLARLPAAERARLRYGPDRVVLDEDRLASFGPQWLQMQQAVAVRDGVLHVQAVSVIARYDDPRLAAAPDTVRGTRNCHVIAPDYLQRLIAGDEPLP